MKRTHTDVRAKCRELYGNDWWNVEPDVKKKRQDYAIAALTSSKSDAGKKENESKKSEKKDMDDLLKLLHEGVPRSTDISISKLTSPIASCYNALAESMGAQANEKRWVFHGTRGEIVPNIILQGFNRSFCGRNATVYGKGVYFAKNIAYSAQSTYSPPDKEGYKHILACKLLVGQACLGNSNMVVPDYIDNHRHFDTSVNTLSDPSIFVAYKDMQALPEYEIKFRTK